jgi:hypothetical protein
MQTIEQVKSTAVAANIAAEQFQYEEHFIDGGKVALYLIHPDTSKERYYIFSNYDDLKACAIECPFIPLSQWETLCIMLDSTTAFHAQENIV